MKSVNPQFQAKWLLCAVNVNKQFMFKSFHLFFSTGCVLLALFYAALTDMKNTCLAGVLFSKASACVKPIIAWSHGHNYGAFELFFVLIIVIGLCTTINCIHVRFVGQGSSIQKEA